MRATLLIHILAGGVGLVSGGVALSTAKGAWLHRKSGTLFVSSMLVMSATGVWIAAVRSLEISLIAGLLSTYLVITAQTAIQQPNAWPRWLDSAAMLVALVSGLASAGWGVEALIAVDGHREGVPAAVYLTLGAVALFAAAADARMIHAGELHSPQRLPRHVWRMCFALFITAGSFFLGELLGVRSAHGQFAVPPPLRIPVLLALPVVAVLLVMLYWLRRVRVRNIQRAAPALRSQPAGD